MNFIKNHPEYYIPIILAPFLICKTSCYNILKKKYTKYQEFISKNRYEYDYCSWCGKKGEKGRCSECFIRIFNDPR